MMRDYAKRDERFIDHQNRRHRVAPFLPSLPAGGLDINPTSKAGTVLTLSRIPWVERLEGWEPGARAF